MVLAQGRERNLPSEHQLVVALVVRKRREGEFARGEQLGVTACHPGGRPRHRLVGHVEPKRHEEVARGGFGRFEIDAPVGDDVQVGTAAGERDVGHVDVSRLEVRTVDAHAFSLTAWSLGADFLPGITSVSLWCHTGWSPAVSTLKP